MHHNSQNSKILFCSFLCFLDRRWDRWLGCCVEWGMWKWQGLNWLSKEGLKDTVWRHGNWQHLRILDIWRQAACGPEISFVYLKLSCDLSLPLRLVFLSSVSCECDLLFDYHEVMMSCLILYCPKANLIWLVLQFLYMTYGFSKDIASVDFKLRSEEHCMPASGNFFF